MSDIAVALDPEDLTASELERRYLDEVADLKVHRDVERTALRLASLLQSAVHRLRMEESRAGSPDSDRPGGDPGGDADPFWHAPVHTVGGGWRWLIGPRPRSSKTSLRPH